MGPWLRGAYHAPPGPAFSVRCHRRRSRILSSKRLGRDTFSWRSKDINETWMSSFFHAFTTINASNVSFPSRNVQSRLQMFSNNRETSEKSLLRKSMSFARENVPHKRANTLVVRESRSRSIRLYRYLDGIEQRLNATFEPRKKRDKLHLERRRFT